jgi:hypothetical protein
MITMDLVIAETSNKLPWNSYTALFNIMTHDRKKTYEIHGIIDWTRGILHTGNWLHKVMGHHFWSFGRDGGAPSCTQRAGNSRG